MIQKILNIQNENLQNAVETLQEKVTLVMIKETNKQYYIIEDTIVPQHKGDYKGNLKTLEDYEGVTYQNEYFRKIQAIINDIQFEADMECIDYEEYLGWSLIPVKVLNE